jgi:hypothetical protein
MYFKHNDKAWKTHLEVFKTIQALYLGKPIVVQVEVRQAG